MQEVLLAPAEGLSYTLYHLLTTAKQHSESQADRRLGKPADLEPTQKDQKSWILLVF